MSPAFRYTLLWLVASAVMIVAALSSIASAYTAGHYVPDNADAFYHARRILDMVMTGQPVMQFDPKIHAPEGSWLTWPWGFDTLLATITNLFGPYADENAANRVLMNIPPIAAVPAMGLVIVIARQLALPLLHAALFAFGFALLPTAFRAFSVANVDHHFAELTWSLATLCAGLWFFRGVRSLAAGITLGVVLGSAVAIHNSLFILQVPVCATLALRWLRRDPLPERAQVLGFAAALLLTTLAVCVPSEPWRRGFFEFYTLSWFHLYVAALSAAFCASLALLARSRATLIALGVCAVAAAAPLLHATLLAGRFVTGSLDTILNISEAKSPYRLLITRGESESTMYMSYLMLLMLPMSLLNAWWAWRKRDAALQFVAVTGFLGLVLLQLQYRFSVFGLVPMLLTPVLAAKLLAESRPAWAKLVAAGVVALFVVAWLPTLTLWRTTFILGNNMAYFHQQSVWPRLAALCESKPGIALASIEAGHWIRYHTACPVIGNVFLLTPQHARKAREVAGLLALSPRQLVDSRRDVEYVLVFHSVLIRNEPLGETPALEPLRLRLAPLERDLLGPEEGIPRELQKRWEVRTPQGQIYSRLFQVVRD